MSERSLSEKIEELKNKINLVEGDRKAFYETTFYKERQNKERIAQLRKENKELRKQLKDRLSADDHVINQAFQDRPVERAALANKTGRDAVETMDYKVCDTRKKLNALKHVTELKKKRLRELEAANEEMAKDSEEAKSIKSGESSEAQRLRELENQLDKTKMKLKEAEHICRTYEQIKARLQEEHLTFGNTLDDMEKEIVECKTEIQQLQATEEEAKRSRDSAVEQQRRAEETVYAMRKRRELEIQQLKAEAEEKQQHYERIERRMAMRDGGQELLGERAGSSIGEEQQEKITDLQEAFKRIKDATGVSDLKEVVVRFEEQGATREHLEAMKADSEKRIRELREERDQLQAEFDDVKYSGECKLSSGQQLLERFQNQLLKEEEELKTVESELESVSQVLVQSKAGVEHLSEKLGQFRASKTKGERGSDERVLETLGQCEEKLAKLVEDLGDADIDAELQSMRAEEFNLQVAQLMPASNERVTMADKAYDDDDSDSLDDDGEVLSREKVKKQSQQLIDKKTKKRAARRKKKK